MTWSSSTNGSYAAWDTWHRENVACHSSKIRSILVLTAGMTDQVLATLFGEVGRGTVIVLEDIDCAGVSTKRQSRPRETDGDSDAGTQVSESSDSDISEDSIEELDDGDQNLRPPTERGASARPTVNSHRRVSTRQPRSQVEVQPVPQANALNVPPPSTVTLAGLLNVIDGLGSPEGHILIMTSNFPENLDEALVRPGRVDLQVKLDYADRQQL